MISIGYNLTQQNVAVGVGSGLPTQEYSCFFCVYVAAVAPIQCWDAK